MTEVPRSIAEQRLNVREGCPPVRQKKRGQAPERTKAIQVEVEKLVEAGIIREVYYHDWLSNPVMVKKHDESWRMTGATYQRLMDKAFENQMGRNIEVYVDDLVVKSHTEVEMVRDIEETFQTLRKINMKLNPKKCSFGLAEGVFLGYVITPEGIKPCPDKMTAVLQLPSPQTIKEVQSLNGKLASLNSPDDRTGDGTDASLLYKPRVTRSGTKLLIDGKAGVITASNNKAEYKALIAGLRIATQMGVKNIQANVDSKLVANQVLGTYIAKEDNMIKYLDIAKGLVLDEVLETKSITAKEVTAVIEKEGPTWMTELVNYLKEGTLPEDEKKARKLRLKARQYELIEGILYKRSFLTPWLKCVGPLQAEYVMREIHEGSCSIHAGPRSVVAKAIRLGYFWLTMHKDAHDMIRKCSDCQVHRPITRHPQQPLTPITAPWPFYKWGIDIAGPFPKGPGKVKFLIVAMDYFTKWIEAKAVATITGGQVKKFVWDNIKPREGIKARLGEGNKNWVEELPHVLWAHRTMIKSSHGDTPFSLTYGTEVVIPVEIGMPTYRTTVVDVVNNDEELRLNLDLLEERQELTAMSEARSKSKMMKYYNSRVRGVAFKP
nr:reverse transcriptase domain-containing protein [Tanacetum cinerariifolium]